MDFEIIKEPWNKYNVSDGSTIKTRVILEKVQRDTQGKTASYYVTMKPLLVVHVAPKFLGMPDARRKTKEEQLQSIEQEDIRIDTMAQEFNEYLLDDGTKIKIHTNITSVSRTKLHNEHGERVYLVESNQLVDIKPSSPVGSH